MIVLQSKCILYNKKITESYFVNINKYIININSKKTE